MRSRTRRYVLRSSEQLNCSPCLLLAVEGWAELLREGFCGDTVILRGNLSAIWLADRKDRPVAVLLYHLYPDSREAWIQLAYVHPDHRKQGLYTRLYSRLRRIALQNKCLTIGSGVSTHNRPMIKAARKNGRRPASLTFIEELETAP